MTTPAFEAFLAEVYTKAEFRRRFLEDPQQMTAGWGLSPEEIAHLIEIDRVGLGLAAKTFARKRARAARKTSRHIQALRTILSAVGKRFLKRKRTL